MKPSWARKQIALLQLETQRQALMLVLHRVELTIRPESDESQHLLRDELKDKLKGLKIATENVEKMESRRKYLWSNQVVKLYQWATKERFAH